VTAVARQRQPCGASCHIARSCAVSGRRQLALRAQPVSELIASALFDVDEVSALGDLALIGLTPPRVGLARAGGLAGGGLGGLLRHLGTPLLDCGAPLRGVNLDATIDPRDLRAGAPTIYERHGSRPSRSAERLLTELGIHFRPPVGAGDPARASDAVPASATGSGEASDSFPGAPHPGGSRSSGPVGRQARQSASGERSGYPASRKNRGLRGEAPTCLLHRWQRCLRFSEGSSSQVNARWLGGDRDLLAGCGVAAFALLLRRLDADGQLNHPPDAYLLGVAELFEHDLVERGERSLRVGLAQVCAVRDSGRELCLGQRHGELLGDRMVEMHSVIEPHGTDAGVPGGPGRSRAPVR